MSLAHAVEQLWDVLIRCDAEPVPNMNMNIFPNPVTTSTQENYQDRHFFFFLNPLTIYSYCIIIAFSCTNFIASFTEVCTGITGL